MKEQNTGRVGDGGRGAVREEVAEKENMRQTEREKQSE